MVRVDDMVADLVVDVLDLTGDLEVLIQLYFGGRLRNGVPPSPDARAARASFVARPWAGSSQVCR